MNIIKIFKRVLIVIAIFLSVAATIILATRADARFIAQSYISSFGKSINLSEISKNEFNFIEASYDELKTDSRCEINQSLLLINKDHPLESDFKPELERFEDTEAFFNSCALESFIKLRKHIADEFDRTLFIMSAYRNKADQSEVLTENEKDFAADPGESEHQAGLGVDVFAKYYAGYGFLKSPVGRYVNKNCNNYGFIIRYPIGKFFETGFSYEPWHLRYVGLPHSEIIGNSAATLEEYIGYFEPGNFYTYKDYIISKQSGDNFILPAEFESAVISPDNTGNYIVTVKIK